MRQDLHRIRFAFPKSDRLAFLGHLEVISTIERSIRRADLPFAVSNGFARRMKVQFSSALPVGVSSKAEYFDLFLTEHLDEEHVLDLLGRYSPTALRPFAAAYVDGSLPALEAWLDRSSWVLDLGTSTDADAFEEGVRRLREQGSFTYMRGTKPKTVDVGESYVSHGLVASDGRLMLDLETLILPTGAMRPEAFVRACYGLSDQPDSAPEYLRCVRVAQHHLDDGNLVEPFQVSLPKLVD
jgi:radical SAM-linked protein